MPALLVALLLASACLYIDAGNPAYFPYQQCVTSLTQNRWRVFWHNYTEDAVAGSRLCFDIYQLPLGPSPQFPGWNGCKSNKRCCNTGINKFKWLPDPSCQRQVASISFNGESSSAVYYEAVGTPQFIGKIVNLEVESLGPAGGLGGVLCFTLLGTSRGGTCPTFHQWMGVDPVTNWRAQDQMPISLYDHKVDNYECCPVSVVDDPMRPTGTASPPPPPATVRSPPPPKSPPPPPPPKASPPPPPPPPPPSPPPPPPPKSSPPPKASPPASAKSSPPPPPPPKVSSPPPKRSPPAAAAVTVVFKNRGNSYSFVFKPTSWSAAEAACMAITGSTPGHLAAITSGTEMYNVGNYQRSKLPVPSSSLVGGNSVFWIGLRGSATGPATAWADGQAYTFGVNYTAPHSGPFPPPAGTCVALSCIPNGACTWVDQGCSAPTSGYLCEQVGTYIF